MTREQIDALAELHKERDKVLARLEGLADEPRTHMDASLKLGGCHHWFALPKPYIGAQWTAELHDIERRIRVAGGTV